MVCVACEAATPTIYSFTNFNTQFTTPDGTNMVIKSGALLTNVSLIGAISGNGTNLTNIQATNIVGTLPVSIGGTGTNSARTVGNNVGNFQMSPTSGDNALTNMLNATPSFINQLGFSFYGNKVPFVWMSGSTTISDWQHEFQFGSGISGSGDSTYSDPLLQDTIFDLNGSPTGWARSGDSYVISRNWSTNSGSSGSSIGVAIMGGADSSGKATNISNNGATFTHVPYNRVNTLMPGNAMLVFNKDAVHLKGFAVAGPNLSGFDSGNYSIQYNDFFNKAFRAPYWVSGVYQPSDAGWRDALVVSNSTGDVGITNGTTVLRALYSAGNSNSVISWGNNSSQISADGFGNIAVGLVGNSNNATFTKFKGASTGTSYASGVRFDSDGAGSGLNYSLETHSIGGTEIGMKGSPLIVGSLGSEGASGGFNAGPTVTVGYGCTNAGDVAGMATLQVIGSIATFLTNQTANYLDPVTNSTILMNGTTITNVLPDASFHAKGRIYTVKNLNSATMNLIATNNQTIDGVYTNRVLAQNQSITVQSDGANWQVLNQSIPTNGGALNYVFTSDANGVGAWQAVTTNQLPSALIAVAGAGLASTVSGLTATLTTNGAVISTNFLPSALVTQAGNGISVSTSGLTDTVSTNGGTVTTPLLSTPEITNTTPGIITMDNGLTVKSNANFWGALVAPSLSSSNASWSISAGGSFSGGVVSGTSASFTTTGAFGSSVNIKNNLQVQGAITTFLTNQSANYTVPTTNSTIIMNGSGITNALPASAAGIKGVIYTVKNANAAALTVNATNNQTFDGGISNIFLAQNDAVTVQSDGANWQVIGRAPAFTMIQTNFNSGQLYTNAYGATIEVSANATLAVAAVVGSAVLGLQVAGTITNYSGTSTLITSIAMNSTNLIKAIVPYNSTYTFTNLSAGAGNSAGVVGGQIMVY